MFFHCVPEDFHCPEGLYEGTNEVFAGEYDMPSLTFEKLGRPPVILDLGGNIGAFSRRMRDLYPDAKIIAYEPHPVNANLFRMNNPDVELHEVAVVEERGDGKVVLFNGHSTGQASLECRGGQKSDDTLMVESLGVEELPPADFLKIDTEGMEYTILKGFQYLDKVAAVALEWHTRGDQFRIGALLTEAGFTCVGQRVDSIDDPYGRHSGILKFVRQEFRELCPTCHRDDGRRQGFKRGDGLFGCHECGDVFT